MMSRSSVISYNRYMEGTKLRDSTVELCCYFMNIIIVDRSSSETTWNSDMLGYLFHKS